MADQSPHASQSHLTIQGNSKGLIDLMKEEMVLEVKQTSQSHLTIQGNSKIEAPQFYNVYPDPESQSHLTIQGNSKSYLRNPPVFRDLEGGFVKPGFKGLSGDGFPQGVGGLVSA